MTNRSSLLLVGYAALTLLVCPSLLWWGAVDQPDEFLEFNTSGLAFLARELAAGRLPAWDPYVLGGMPVAAAPTCLGPWYPAAWVLPVVPLDWFVLGAWLVHLGLGAAGAHRLAEACGAGSTGATAAGVVQLCGTSCVVALVDGELDVVAVLGWLPWALVALHRAFEAAREGAGGVRHAALAAGALGLIGLGSHARFAALAYAALGLHAAVLWGTANREARPGAGRWAALTVALLAVGTLLAAPSVLPAALEVFATRSALPEDEALVGQVLTPGAFAGLLYPKMLVTDDRWYHLGPVVLLIPLALRGNRRVTALVTTGALLFVVAMGSRGPLGWALQPIMGLLYPTEIGAAATGALFLAVAAGLGVDRVVQAPGALDRRGFAAVAGVGCAAVVVGLFAEQALYLDVPETRWPRRMTWVSAGHGAAALAGLVAVLALARRLGARTLAGLLLVLVLADGLAYAWRVEAAIPSPWVAPSDHVAARSVEGLTLETPSGRLVQLPSRPVRDLMGGAPEDLLSHPGHGWAHDPGDDPRISIPRETAQVISGSLRRNAGGATGWPQAGGRAKVPPMPWSVLTHGLSSPGPWAAPELVQSPRVLARTLELLGVRWVVSPVDGWSLPASRRLAPTPEAALRVELLDPRPPALLSPHAVVLPDARAALDELLGGEVDLRASVVLIEPAPPGTDLEGRPAIVGAVSGWSPGRWRVELPAHDGGVLVLTDRFHPGWTASAPDGRALAVLRANLLHVGVVVPGDVRTVAVTFIAPGARAGRWLGLAGFLIVLAGVGLGRRGGPGRRPRDVSDPGGGA